MMIPLEEQTDEVDGEDKSLSMVDEALVAGTIANTNGLLVILAKLVAKGVFDREDLQAFSDSYSKPLDHVGMRENELVGQMQDQMESTLAELMRFLSERERDGESQRVECGQDRAGPLPAARTFDGQPFECVACALQLADLIVQRLDARRRQGARPGAVVRRVQDQQFPDLLEREPGRLGVTDEPQPFDVVRPIAAGRAQFLRLRQQATPLVVADRLDADAAGGRQPRDGEHVRAGLTLYHGTEAIWRFARLEQPGEWNMNNDPTKACRCGNACTCNGGCRCNPCTCKPCNC